MGSDPRLLILWLAAAVAIMCSGCQKTCYEFEPRVAYFPNPCVIESRPSAFPPLNQEEARTDWGKELRIGYAFAKEQDYYRAITAFKRALVFIPQKFLERRMQIEFCVVESYYFGYKYKEAIETFQAGSLPYATESFPGYADLLFILYECYTQDGQPEKAACILETLNLMDEAKAGQLELYQAFSSGDLCGIERLTDNRPEKSDYTLFLQQYRFAAKSVEKAQIYQALLPGAGYLYVGQKNSGLTSFLVNALFIWASYRFFEKGYPAAGVITASLETGWYFGGINGAGLAAKEYNERLWEVNAKEFMRGRQLFPILMIGTSF